MFLLIYFGRNIFLNCFYTIPIHTFSRCQTARFALSNGPFRIVKWTISQRQTVCIWNGLVINWLRIRFEKNRIMNYIYINYSFSFLSNWFSRVFLELIFQCPFVSADFGICYHKLQWGFRWQRKTYPRQVAKYAKIPQWLFLSLVEHNLCALCGFARENYL